MDAKRLTNEQFFEILEILKTKDSKEELEKVCTKLGIGENNTPLSVLSFDTDKIKEYVFPSPKLPEIRGGSQLIKDVLSQKSIEKIVEGESLSRECVIYAAGGGGLLIIPKDKAEKIAKLIKEKLPKETLGATVTCACLDVHPVDLIEGYRSQEFTFEKAKELIKANPELQSYFELEPNENEDLTEEKWKDKKCFGELVTVLSTKLQKKKGEKELSPFFEAIPYNVRCTSCGMLPAKYTDQYDGNWNLCESCYKKKEIGRRLKGAKDLEELGKVSDGRAKGYVSVIYADGNGMGSVLQELKTIDVYRRWSKGVNSIFERVTSPSFLSNFDIDTYERLITGGDDVIMFLPADKAFKYVQELVNQSEEELKILAEECNLSPEIIKKLGLGVGVVIAHYNFPALYLVEYAEKLLKLAKKHGKRKKLPESAIDFVILTDSSPINTSIKSLRNELFLSEEESFKLTEQSYSNLRKESVPKEILNKLKFFENNEYKNKEEFIEALKKSIGEEKIDKYKSLILKYATYDLSFTSKPFTLEEYNTFLENALQLKNIVPRSQIYKLREVIKNKPRAVAENEFLYQLVRDKNLQKWIKAIKQEWNTLEVKELRERIWREEDTDKKKYITQFIDYAEVYHFISQKEGENSET